MRLFKQNESTAARRELFVTMLDEADYATPKSGLTLSVEIVKAGGTAFAAIAGSSSEIGATGTYKIALAVGDLDTPGPAMLRISATGAVAQFVPLTVVGYDPFDAAGLGLSELHLAKATLANKRTHSVETGVNVIKDDDGATTLLTLTPSEADGVVTVTPS
jgi:hypothetical protein